VSAGCGNWSFGKGGVRSTRTRAFGLCTIRAAACGVCGCVSCLFMCLCQQPAAVLKRARIESALPLFWKGATRVLVLMVLVRMLATAAGPSAASGAQRGQRCWWQVASCDEYRK